MGAILSHLGHPYAVLGEPHHKAFDISGTIPPDSWYGTLLKGVFNFQPDPTTLQVTVWLLYLIPTLALFLAPTRTPAKEPVRDGA